MNRSVILLLLFCVSSSVEAADSRCRSQGISSPLGRSLIIESKFDSVRRHYGVDYRAKDDDVVVVKDGKIRRINYELRSLRSENARTGLKKQGYGVYVVIRHSDGSESLYAHLDAESVKSLKVGLPVVVGSKIGRSDSSGGVTGPHLHFEYSDSGDIFDKKNKVDPDQCVLRRGTVVFRGITPSQGGLFELSLDGKIIGKTDFVKETRFDLQLFPGTYQLDVRLLRAQLGKTGGYAFELSDEFSIVNTEGAVLGSGDSIDEISEGKTNKLLMRVGR